MNKSSLLNSRMKTYAHSSVDEMYHDLGTSPNGLKLSQVEHMKKKYGQNVTVGKKSDTIFYRLRRAFVNPFTIILFVLAIVSLIADIFMIDQPSNFTSFTIISAMILLSGSVRLIQEIRAKKASERFNKLVNSEVSVKRNEIILNVNAEELVVGDIVILSAGNRVPADVRLSKTDNLFVSQATITGESEITEKKSDIINNRNLAFSDYENLAFMGTTIISGKGEGVVLAVGKDTVYGSFTNQNSEKDNSFQKGANSIAWVMIKFMAILVPIVFLVAGITKGNWLESFLFALSVAVGLTPEMLPMVITACLAKGSISMSKKQTIIKDINAMQGFGSMDVLCVDKTGTLTNESILLEYYIDVLGNESEDVLDLAFLNSYFHSGARNPIDDAILKCKTMPKREEYFDALITGYRKLDEKPFDYDRMYVSTFVEDTSGERLHIIKGDVDAVYSRCGYIEHNGRIHKIGQADKSNVDAVVADMLEDGMKVIALAKQIINDSRNDTENSMILMGYLVFFDAPKKSAKQAIKKLRNLNVNTKILTGDRPEIAASICKRVGIDSNNILTGIEIEAMTDSEIMLAVEKSEVFAGLSPVQKVRIITALRENGHTVGFLGDGMNDIPAICEADVGISVDTAVQAAKDVADVVLLQKDLNVLEQGILEGRKTFANMAKYIKITASSNFGNIFSIIIASAFLPFLPITAIQILFLNLLYDIICMVLPWDNVDDEDYEKPRIWSGKSLGKFMLVFGPISSIFDIITFGFLYFVLCPSLCGGLLFTQISDAAMQLEYISVFQTGWFLVSMWTQVLIIHMLRTKKTPFVQSRAAKPVELITFLGIIVLTVLTFTKTSGLFGMTSLPIWYFVFLLFIVVLYMIMTTVIKQSYIKKYHELI